MTTTAEWKARQPQRQAAREAHGQDVRDRNAQLGPDDLFAALTKLKGPRSRGTAADHVGARWARKALHEHLGWEPRIDAVVRVITESFPTQHQARLEQAAREAAETERRRKAAAREAREAAKIGAEQAAIRRRVEELRAERRASEDTELLETARTELAAK